MSDHTINWLISKSIHVSYSHNTEFAISENPTTKEILMSKLENESYHKKMKINRDGESFNISINDSYLCVKNGVMSKCKDPSLFDLGESKFGYKIIYYGKCLTIGKQMEFKKCDPKLKSQDFIFRDATKFYCDKDSLLL